MYAYSGILAALFRRERTGVGAAIEVSLFEALAEWMGFPAYYAQYGGQRVAPQRRQPLLNRSLRSLRVRGGRGRLPRHPERAGMGEVLRGGAGACRIGGRCTLLE
jgi:crotonobetainyl-CoA:carnitine CoA-transferase CaiB-like acyl-CoA transferase